MTPSLPPRCWRCWALAAMWTAARPWRRAAPWGWCWTQPASTRVRGWCVCDVSICACACTCVCVYVAHMCVCMLSHAPSPRRRPSPQSLAARSATPAPSSAPRARSTSETARCGPARDRIGQDRIVTNTLAVLRVHKVQAGAGGWVLQWRLARHACSGSSAHAPPVCLQPLWRSGVKDPLHDLRCHSSLVTRHPVTRHLARWRRATCCTSASRRPVRASPSATRSPSRCGAGWVCRWAQAHADPTHVRACAPAPTQPHLYPHPHTRKY